MAGVDLTMMVFSWAQLGYVKIIPDRHGHVMIVKKMEMGNERTEFENRCFQSLFSRTDAIDATGMPYAKLYNKVVQTISGAKELHRRKAGNTRLFRVISAGVSGLCGVCPSSASSAPRPPRASPPVKWAAACPPPAWT